jgi:CBS domain-containing protein
MLQRLRSHSICRAAGRMSVRHLGKGSTDVTSKPKMRARNILAMKHSQVFAMPETITVAEAISNMAVNNITSALVINDKDEVAGIFTSRDLLRYLHYGKSFTNNKNQKKSTIVSKMSPSQKIKHMSEVLVLPIHTLVTKTNKMVFCSLTDTARSIREIMFQLKIRNIPVVHDNAVVGIISSKDLADSSFSLEDTGGKKGFMKNIIGRVGLPEHTSVKNYHDVLAAKYSKEAAVDEDLDANIDNLSEHTLRDQCKERARLSSSKSRTPRNRVEMSSYALPHPFKENVKTVAENRKALGFNRELCDDNSLNADAHFVAVVPVTNATNAGSQVTPCVLLLLLLLLFYYYY